MCALDEIRENFLPQKVGLGQFVKIFLLKKTHYTVDYCLK